MRITKLLLTIVITFIMILCTACEPKETEYDIGYKAGYDDGYNVGYDEGYNDTSEDSYEYGYTDGIKDAAEKAYDYLYKEYGIDDDSITDYCQEP